MLEIPAEIAVSMSLPYDGIDKSFWESLLKQAKAENKLKGFRLNERKFSAMYAIKSISENYLAWNLLGWMRGYCWSFLHRAILCCLALMGVESEFITVKRSLSSNKSCAYKEIVLTLPMTSLERVKNVGRFWGTSTCYAYVDYSIWNNLFRRF